MRDEYEGAKYLDNWPILKGPDKIPLLDIRNLGILCIAYSIPSEWVYNWNAVYGVAYNTVNSLSWHLVYGGLFASRAGVDLEL